MQCYRVIPSDSAGVLLYAFVHGEVSAEDRRLQEHVRFPAVFLSRKGVVVRQELQRTRFDVCSLERTLSARFDECPRWKHKCFGIDVE